MITRPGLITCVCDSPCFTINNKECATGTRLMFGVELVKILSYKDLCVSDKFKLLIHMYDFISMRDEPIILQILIHVYNVTALCPSHFLNESQRTMWISF